MATIDSASHWNDGAAPCRNQRAPRIGDIQRHKAVELERSLTSSSSGSSSTNSSTNKSPTATTPTTTNPFILRPSPNNRTSNNIPTEDNWEKDDHPPVEVGCTDNKELVDDGVCKESLSSRQELSSDKLVQDGTGTSEFEYKESGGKTKCCSDAFRPTETQLISGDTHVQSKKEKKSLPSRNEDIVQTSRDEAEPDESVDQSDDDQGEGDDKNSADRFASVCRQTTVIQRPQNRFVVSAQTQEEVATPAIVTTKTATKRGAIPKMQSADSRSHSPRTPLSPSGSPLGSPRSNRRRTPLKESRRISIEQSGDAVQVNQYKLMEEIGKGAYGLVKLAYNKADSTHYAMKMLSKSKLVKKAGLMGRGPKKATSLTPLQRVYKEIAVLKKLNHPNVVKLVEVLDDPAEDCLYLAFELEQQGEVLRIPTERPLSEERAWSVFRDALQGLEYLHYQRIIHSDIKPGNLLLGEDGHVKIADLGVCTEFLDEDATMDNKSPAGTPAFRAPETLLEGEHSYSGKAADIWSLGATLYAIVYGNVPFVGLTVPAVYDKIKHETLKFPSFPAISDDLRDLISKMLVKDPAQRITLPQIKDHRWVTVNGKYPLPSEEDNCRLIELETEDLNTVCRSVPKMFDTFVLIKAMLKNHSFQNPFSRSPSGRAPQRGGSRLERFVTAGRSKSAPCDYGIESKQVSSDNILPVVTETVPNSSTDSLDQPTEDSN